jgi:uncharacterized damage-inducible protein DinB
MNSLDYLGRDFAYNAWANGQSLRSLDTAATVPDRAREVMAHILAAESLWLRRLKKPAPELDLWPPLSLTQCCLLADEVWCHWAAFLACMTEQTLNEEILYHTSEQEMEGNLVEQILRGVILHSAYHRGQIAMLLGRAGQKPATTDFIDWTLRKHVPFRNLLSRGPVEEPDS